MAGLLAALLLPALLSPPAAPPPPPPQYTEPPPSQQAPQVDTNLAIIEKQKADVATETLKLIQDQAKLNEAIREQESQAEKMAITQQLHQQQMVIAQLVTQQQQAQKASSSIPAILPYIAVGGLIIYMVAKA